MTAFKDQALTSSPTTLFNRSADAGANEFTVTATAGDVSVNVSPIHAAGEFFPVALNVPTAFYKGGQTGILAVTAKAATTGTISGGITGA